MMIDFAKLYEYLDLGPGEKLTIEVNGMRAEMSSEGMTVKGQMSKASALQTALTAAQICKEIRGQLVYPHADSEAIKKLAGDLIDAGELLRDWADK